MPKISKRIIGSVLLGSIIVLAFQYLNVIKMTEKNGGWDLQGNPYYVEGYGKGDIVLVVENSYYEILVDFKLN
jgi:hypothetical protein